MAGTHGAGDSAERPAFRRPRSADARRQHVAAERRPERAAARPGLVLVHVGRQPRDVGQHDGQRHQPERPVEQPGDVPAVDQHGVGVQGRQLDVQRRVRPQLGRDRERRDALGQQPAARRRRSTSTAIEVRFAQLLQSAEPRHVRQRDAAVAVQPETVRRQPGRAGRQEPLVLLRQLRRPAPLAGRGPQFRDVDRRAARRPSPIRWRRSCSSSFRSRTTSPARGPSVRRSRRSRSTSTRSIRATTCGRTTTSISITRSRRIRASNRTRRARRCRAFPIGAADTVRS